MLVDVQVLVTKKVDFFEAVACGQISWEYEFVSAGCGPEEHLTEEDDIYMIIRQEYQTSYGGESPEIILFECADLAKYFDYCGEESHNLSRREKRLLILKYMEQNQHKLINADDMLGYWWW